jgi:hypothetical protein
MRFLTILTICAALVGACSKTDDGKIVVHTPGEVEVKTRSDTISLPKINVPKIGTKEETLVVRKPVIRRDTSR